MTPTVRAEGPSPAASWLADAARRLGLSVDVDGSVLLQAAETPALGGSVIAVHGARSPHGQGVTYAPTLEQHGDGVLDSVELAKVTVPPERLFAVQRAAMARMEADALTGACTVRFPLEGDVTTLTVTVGVDAGSAWTLDGCRTSLAENQVRAVLDLPLGTPALLGSFVATASVCSTPGMFAAFRHCMARDPGLRIHLTGLTAPVGMTIGHVCVVSEDADDARRRARHAADYLNGTIEE